MGSETNGKSGIFIGLNRGMVQTASKKLGWKTRPVLRKGKTSRRAHAVRELIREIAGLSPLEKRMTDLIRTGVQQKEKRAVKLARAKLGTQRRGEAKRNEMVKLIQIASTKKK